MPRRARKISRTGVYHVMLRGINRQDIFHDEEDYLRFLSVVRECKERSEFELYAYCLMSNHIHLLIKAGKEPLEIVFKRIGSKYVYWYNTKYSRTGHLFQDRFKSEVVENTAGFLSVLRYIIQNPMKAGMESSPGSYPWSSYHSYFGKPDKITEADYVRGMFPSIQDMSTYLNQKNEDALLDIIHRKPEGVTDEQAGAIMREITGCRSVGDFQRYDRKQQKEFAGQLRKKKLSIGQIARITGMSKATVSRIK